MKMKLIAYPVMKMKLIAYPVMKMETNNVSTNETNSVSINEINAANTDESSESPEFEKNVINIDTKVNSLESDKTF